MSLGDAVWWTDNWNFANLKLQVVLRGRRNWADRRRFRGSLKGFAKTESWAEVKSYTNAQKVTRETAGYKGPKNHKNEGGKVEVGELIEACWNETHRWPRAKKNVQVASDVKWYACQGHLSNRITIATCDNASSCLACDANENSKNGNIFTTKWRRWCKRNGPDRGGQEAQQNTGIDRRGRRLRKQQRWFWNSVNDQFGYFDVKNEQ